MDAAAFYAEFHSNVCVRLSGNRVHMTSPTSLPSPGSSLSPSSLCRSFSASSRYYNIIIVEFIHESQAKSEKLGRRCSSFSVSTCNGSLCSVCQVFFRIYYRATSLDGKQHGTKTTYIRCCSRETGFMFCPTCQALVRDKRKPRQIREF